jgi:hypothetical protein
MTVDLQSDGLRTSNRAESFIIQQSFASTFVPSDTTFVRSDMSDEQHDVQLRTIDDETFFVPMGSR